MEDTLRYKVMCYTYNGRVVQEEAGSIEDAKHLAFKMLAWYHNRGVYIEDTIDEKTFRAIPSVEVVPASW